MDVPWTFVTTCEQMFFNCKFMCTLAKFMRMKGYRNHSFCGFFVSFINLKAFFLFVQNPLLTSKCHFLGFKMAKIWSQ
jgi:hypothetical protein